MSDEHDPLSWVKYAEEDHLAARSALRRRLPLTNVACFHAQQCAEKYLKAMLVARGYAFLKVHDLLVLKNECEQAGILAPISEDQLSLLSYYAVRARYPGDAPTPDDAHEAMAIAQTVRRFTRRFLEIK